MSLTTSKYRKESARKKLDFSKESRGKKNWRFAIIFGIISALSVVVYIVAFAGTPKVLPPISLGRAAPTQLISLLDFSFESHILTEARRRQVEESVSPSYKINKDSFPTVEANFDKLEEILAEMQTAYEKLKPEDKKSEKLAEDYSAQIRRGTTLSISPEDVVKILQNSTAQTREDIFNQAIFRLKGILNDGVYRNADPVFSDKSDLAGTYKLEGVTGARQNRLRSENEANEELKKRLLALGSINTDMSYVFFRIFNQEIKPNLEFDDATTAQKRKEAAEKVSPVIVKVRQGETLLDQDSAVTELAQEKCNAFRKEMSQQFSSDKKSMSTAIEDFFCSFFLVVGASLFIIVSKTRTNKRPKTISILVTLLFINLALERFLVQVCNAEIFKSGETLLQVFTYATPVLIGPLLQVLLFGSYTGFVMSLVLTALATLMLSQGMDYFILLFVSSLAAIYFFDGAKTRYRVLFGGFMYGLILCFSSVTMGAINGVDTQLVGLQAAAALASGTLTGILATVLLPLLEKLFDISSNITLLELTDFNNPLLNRMQIEAPGTYHHSVMVAHLAEYAASQIRGANALKCRVGALYHDIGKLIKPEFFAENQTGGRNPHDTQTPSMSALIIKSHIKEGVELARLAKLPRPVIEAIEEHHGTSIILYFYNKAQNIATSSGNCADIGAALRAAGIEESTYRHEGKKPQSIETAIILLADSCEAASRSLKRITPHGIEELVDKIVRMKMNDGQLDEAPITIQQLTTIKKSFVFTMLNMLHSRVEYNNEPQKQQQAEK